MAYQPNKRAKATEDVDLDTPIDLSEIPFGRNAGGAAATILAKPKLLPYGSRPQAQNGFCTHREAARFSRTGAKRRPMMTSQLEFEKPHRTAEAAHEKRTKTRCA